jgi:hypothetical protein
VADALRREPDTQVELVDGAQGEFTVLVDDRVAIERKDASAALPEVQEVIRAIRNAREAAGARH